MSDPFLDPSRWALPTADRTKGYIDELLLRKTPQQKGQGTRYDLSRGISPVDLYCYLKSRFGPPNGFMMALRAPAVDNFCHWHYTLVADGTLLNIFGLNVRIEVQLPEFDEPRSIEWTGFEATLSRALEEHRAEIKAVQGTLERWHLFSNPFRRLSSLADGYVERLRDLDVKTLAIPPFPKSLEEFKKHEDEVRKALGRCWEAQALCVNLQLIAPVMAEAAINLIMLLLARPEVRADERLFEDFSRRNIDVRVKSLHLCCVGFVQPIDGSEQPFKEFLRLMNRRNDALHGKIDPSRRIGEDIFFDFRTIPLVRRFQSFNELLLEESLGDLDPESAVRDINTVHEFVGFLVSRLALDIQPQIQRAFDEQMLGHRPETRSFGVILPKEIMDVMFAESPEREPDPSAG